jgi:hypothetical protein
MYLREIASGHRHQLFALAIKLHLAAYRPIRDIKSPCLPIVILPASYGQLLKDGVQ